MRRVVESTGVDIDPGGEDFGCTQRVELFRKLFSRWLTTPTDGSVSLKRNSLKMKNSRTQISKTAKSQKMQNVKFLRPFFSWRTKKTFGRSATRKRVAEVEQDRARRICADPVPRSELGGVLQPHLVRTCHSLAKRQRANSECRPRARKSHTCVRRRPSVVKLGRTEEVARAAGRGRPHMPRHGCAC